VAFSKLREGEDVNQMGLGDLGIWPREKEAGHP